MIYGKDRAGICLVRNLEEVPRGLPWGIMFFGIFHRSYKFSKEDLQSEMAEYIYFNTYGNL